VTLVAGPVARVVLALLAEVVGFISQTADVLLIMAELPGKITLDRYLV
jgi:hypothetical protein